MKSNTFTDKSALRAEAKKALSDIKNRKEKERAVTEKALNFIQSGNYTKIAVYMSFGTELSTGLLIDGLFGLNKKVYATFNEVGIGFPYPQLTVHQAKD